MCLIVFAHHHHPDYPFIFGVNRDERHERPTQRAHFWEDDPEILAGRDKVAGGTWCGVTRGGRFAALSNYRDPAAHETGAPSRGHLVTGFLSDRQPPEEYLNALAEKAAAYNGFNLVVGDLPAGELAYFSNRGGPPRRIPSGVHGLSNDLLDTPWPKVTVSKNRLADLVKSNRGSSLEPAKLFEILQSTDRPPDDKLPDTGLDREIERLVAAPFIVNSIYGTRSSTVILLHKTGQLTFVERTYGSGGTAEGEVRFEVEIF